MLEYQPDLEDNWGHFRELVLDLAKNQPLGSIPQLLYAYIISLEERIDGIWDLMIEDFVFYRGLIQLLPQSSPRDLLLNQLQTYIDLCQE